MTETVQTTLSGGRLVPVTVVDMHFGHRTAYYRNESGEPAWGR